MDANDEVVIVAAKRTAIGRFGGSLGSVPATELGARCIVGCLDDAGLDPAHVDEVIMGNVITAGSGQNPARQASLSAGLSNATCAFTINKVCGSGLKAVQLGWQAVRCGDADIVIAGGMENMSSAPYVIPKARWGARMGHMQAVDTMLHDGLWDIFGDYHMGVTAENLAERFDVTREDQDGFACESQKRAGMAIASGRFLEEIVPVEVRVKRRSVTFDVDEHPRPDVTREDLSKMRPAFSDDGTVTAGNASGINDGGAALVIASRERAEGLGLPVLCALRGFAAAGCDPAYMGLGPVLASRKLLERQKQDIDGIDLIESNEAFAVQALVVLRELGLDPAQVNVNGGAIALGHPIGASGARILVTLVHEMARRGSRRGLATTCIGGGQGISAYVERGG